MIAYLINQYPQASQTFIRREILALEKLGQPIECFSVRRWNINLVDEGDQSEQAKTRYVLDAGAIGILLATVRTLLFHPLKLIKTFAAACRIGRRSERGLRMHLMYVAEACVLLRWFAQRNIHHVHCHFGTNSTTVALFVRLLGGPPYSFTTHGPEEWEKARSIALPEKFRRCDFATVISSFGLSQAYRWSDPRDWHKLHIVHCGLDDQFLQATRTPPPAEPRLVTVGRFGQAKGHLILLKAAAQLAREKIPFELTLIGDGIMRAPIEQSIAEHHLEHHVKLVGWKSNRDVLQAIQNSRALVLPSFSEGLPVVIMESLALERPVITTYVAGIPELVRNELNGWLVPAGAVDPLVQAMRQALILPPDKLWDMGKAGATLVRQNHTAITEAQKLLDLFAGSKASDDR